MKLFTRYNRINLLSTVIIFLLASGAFYFLLRYVLIAQVDEDLKLLAGRVFAVRTYGTGGTLGDVPELAAAARLSMVDLDSGHWPMVSAPDALAAQVDQIARDWCE